MRGMGSRPGEVGGMESQGLLGRCMGLQTAKRKAKGVHAVPSRGSYTPIIPSGMLYPSSSVTAVDSA